MDKHTLSNYGFLLVATILVAALLAVLSPVTPFGDYVRSSINEVVDNYIEKTNVEEVENKKEDITPDSNNTDTIWKITINLLYEDGKQIREPIEMEIKHGETLNVQEKLPKIDGYAPTNIPKENTIVNNETYNIIYVKNLYSIEYITNGGTILSTKPTSYLYGETIELPSNVIKEGYYFAGWYQKSDFSDSRLDEITPQIKGDLVLYARWERNAYTITYFSNGKEITNIENKYKLAFYGESVVLPILSAQDGKNFGGWYTNKYFEGNNVVSTPQYPKENLIYYAFWTNEGYSIRYETNGGTFNGSYSTIYISGQHIKLPTNITKNGYELVGWYTDSSYTTLVKEILPTDYGNKVFYAKWKYGEYNITYDLQGGTSNGTLTNKYTYNPDTSPLTYNKDISKPGYTFVGWKDVDLGRIETGVSAGKYGDIVLIAQYISRTYEITYNGNGGTPQTTKQNIRYGEPYGNGPTVLKDGYDFTGWYTSASGGEKINSTSTYALTNNQTLYAHWTPATYNITYIKDGGEFTTSPTTTYKFGVGLTLPTNITKDKYTFGGWYLDSNLTTAITNISTTTFGDITVCAKWIPATYSITYNTDGGTMTSNNYPTRYTYGVGVETLPTSQKTGYNFTGWEDNNGTIIDKIYSSDYGDKTLTATYQLKEYVINIVLVDSSGNYILNNNSEKFIFKQSIEYGKLYSYNADNFTNLFSISDKYYHEAFTFQKQQSDAISNNIFEEEIKLTCYNWRILYVEEYYNNVKYEDFNFDASYKYRQPQHGTATLEIPQYQNNNMWILKDNGLGKKTVDEYVGNGGNTLKIYYDPYTFNIIWDYDSSTEIPTATLPTTYCYGQIPFDVPLFTKAGYVFDGYTVTNGTATPGTTKYSITPSSPADITLKPKWIPEPQTGDTYEEGDYIYKYNQYYSGDSWKSDTSQNGWGVRVKDTSKTSYGKILSEIVGKPITKMSYTFYNCTSLTTAPSIPDGVTNMFFTFSGCTKLTTAPVIPSSVTSMTYTFDGCTSLTAAPTIPSSVTSMSGTFKGCTSLTTAPTIPNSVKYVSYTFQDCTSLTTAPTIPEGVTDMYHTFDGCTSLATAPIIPNSVINMEWTFRNCTSLTTAPAIPNSVKYMSLTFDGCRSLTTAPIIPSNVTDMRSTFDGCTSLATAPKIPNSVTDMSGTFRWCTSLTKAPTIPNSVTDMSSTFSGCTSLTKAPTIPNSVTNMERTFSGCTKLTTAPTIPSRVTNMSNTFNGCTSLTTAPTIPNSVTNMQATFYKCSSLTTAPTIPNSVTDMSYTFQECTALTTPPPTIPSSVTNMFHTFYKCTSLTTAPTIPSSVTDMSYTFYWCSSLTGTITINANPTSYGCCFRFTRKPITLTGSSTKLSDLANTAEMDNVKVG